MSQQSEPKSGEPHIVVPMVCYVVYDHPSDFPEEYVCRRQFAFPGRIEFDRELLLRSNSLRTVEDALAATGLVRITPEEDDDPCIASIWI